MNLLAGVRQALLVNNPICIKCVRARVRLKHILSWGTITLVVTAFVCSIVYLTQTERELATAEDAAKSLLLPIIIIQGVILMLLGTGAVASGLAQERDGGLLDYHRMTPMTPTSKILGFLFGLPAREYFLFALTLPFLLFAVMKSGFDPWKLVKFYVVFFSSVWLYHMTGLVAGMASSKPRFAAMLAQGMVVLLYFVLPQLSWVGFSFFEFLTIRPTLFGMVLEEMSDVQRMQAGAVTDLGRYQQVPFFGWTLNATAYTLLVQFFLLTFMYIVVYRKWKDDLSHALSKLGSVVFFAGTLVFLVGNLWPIIEDPRHFDDLVRRLGIDRGGAPAGFILFVMGYAFLMISGVTCLVLINLITPSKHTVVKGLRLARKLGREREPLNSDAASSLPATLIMIALTTGACVLLADLAASTGRFFDTFPGLGICAAPLVLNAAVFLFVQGMRERFSGRVFLVATFLLWMIPFFATMILFAAKEAWEVGSYVGLIFPPQGQWFATYWFFHEAGLSQQMGGDGMSASVLEELPMLATAATVLYALLAIGTQIELRRWKSVLRASERPLEAPASREDEANAEPQALAPDLS